MRRSRKAGLLLVAGAWASLLLGRVYPFGDAQLSAPSAGQQAIPMSASIPQDARTVLTEKCVDCHSVQPRARFYGRFAPASWLMERDILEGRQHLNLSAWNSYSPEQQETLKAKIVQEIKSGAMPPRQYTVMHWNARITAADVQTLQQWARQDSSPSIQTATVASGEGDAVRGRLIFEKRCTGCHSMEMDREGPRLKGVYGRMSGTVAGFTSSSSLRDAHLTWNDTTLDQWLADPDKLVPGNDMEFHVAKADERRDLIRFLKENSGK